MKKKIFLILPIIVLMITIVIITIIDKNDYSIDFNVDLELSINDTKITNSIKYAELLPPDFSVVLLKDYMAIDEHYKEKLIKIPEFNKWLQSKGRMLNGII
jgi:hypothetical protein